jgi:hypothetical protein
MLEKKVQQTNVKKMLFCFLRMIPFFRSCRPGGAAGPARTAIAQVERQLSERTRVSAEAGNSVLTEVFVKLAEHLHDSNQWKIERDRLIPVGQILSHDIYVKGIGRVAATLVTCQCKIEYLLAQRSVCARWGTSVASICGKAANQQSQMLLTPLLLIVLDHFRSNPGDFSQVCLYTVVVSENSTVTCHCVRRQRLRKEIEAATGGLRAC